MICAVGKTENVQIELDASCVCWTVDLCAFTVIETFDQYKQEYWFYFNNVDYVEVKFMSDWLIAF